MEFAAQHQPTPAFSRLATDLLHAVPLGDESCISDSLRDEPHRDQICLLSGLSFDPACVACHPIPDRTASFVRACFETGY